MLSRRTLIKRLLTIPLLGGLLRSGIPVQSVMAAPAAAAKRNLIEELGLRKKVAQLPHLEYTGMKSEVIVQKGHKVQEYLWVEKILLLQPG